MRYFILTILLVFTSLIVRAQDTIISPDSIASPQHAAQSNETIDQMWNRANTAYINASYPEAIEIYNLIASKGEISHKLYYNIANAYFKTKEIGKSILYYNKAQKLAPTDSDIDHNLAVANTYIKDKIEQIPEFFVSRWIRSLGLSLSCTSWTLVSLATLITMLAGVLLYVIYRSLVKRKVGFYTAITGGILFIVSTIFALNAHSEIVSPSHGIVMSTAVSVKSSPDQSSKDLFVLHEGTKIEVVSSLQNWREVIIADGNIGWIEASAIEMI